MFRAPLPGQRRTSEPREERVFRRLRFSCGSVSPRDSALLAGPRSHRTAVAPVRVRRLACGALVGKGRIRGRAGVPEGWGWAQRRGKAACRKAGEGTASQVAGGVLPPRARRRAALVFLRRFAFLTGRFGRVCTKMTISCEEAVLTSTYNSKVWNNVAGFHFECDIISTGEAVYCRASPFLHNLSSFLYRGEAAHEVSCGVDCAGWRAPLGHSAPRQRFD